MPDFLAMTRARLAGAGTPPPTGNDIVIEIAQHLADVYETALRQGSSEVEAIARVERELAGEIRLRDIVEQRGQRRFTRENITMAQRPFALTTMAELRQAVRTFAARPGYSILVVSTLALALGACTAVFSLFNALLLQPLSYPDPDRLVLLWETEAQDESAQFNVAAPNFLDWQRTTRSFASMGIWEYRTFNVAGAADPEQVFGVRASASLFATLGVRPALGRVFAAGEDAPGHQIAIVSDAVWRTHLASDPQVLGREIRLNGVPHEVIGVMPPSFKFPSAANGIYIPIAFTPLDEQRGSHSFFVVGRLAPTVSFEQARQELQQLGRQLAAEHDDNRGEGATVTRMRELGLRNVRPMLFAFAGAVGLVLLIACVNVANLQMALAVARRREFALRLALGAGLRRLTQQMVAEGMVLALAAGSVSVLLAWMAVQIADVALTPGFTTLPFRGEVPITIDWRVLIFAATVSLGSLLLFAFAPLIGLSSHEPQTVLREGDRGTTRLRGGLRNTLVTAELALAIIVLCSAGLMIRSLVAVLGEEPGLDPRNVLTMQVSLPQDDMYGPPDRATFCRDLADSISNRPAIRAVGAISHLPLAGSTASRSFVIDGQPPPAPDQNPGANYRLTCPGYFAVMGIPMIAGRDFSDRDGRESEPVVILNRMTAERHWPGQDAVGQRIKLGGVESTAPWMTVVGIAENVRHFGLESDARREIYRPYSQAVWPVMTVIAKTVVEPLGSQRDLREAIRQIDPHLPATSARSMEQVIAGSVGWRMATMRLLAAFAGIALLLASLGVYGILAYYVSQRTREFGVRAALGASKRTVALMVVGQSARPLFIGILLGIAGTLLAGTALRELLYEVQPTDPVVLSGVVGLLSAVSLLAAWLPARRAASVDPLVALRQDG